MGVPVRPPQSSGRSDIKIEGAWIPLLRWLTEFWDQKRAEQEGVRGHPPTKVRRLMETSGGAIMVGLCNNRFCMARRRSHKSNGVYLVLDVQAGTFWQTCHDRQDCDGQSSRKWRIPHNIWREFCADSQSIRMTKFR